MLGPKFVFVVAFACSASIVVLLAKQQVDSAVTETGVRSTEVKRSVEVEHTIEVARPIGSEHTTRQQPKHRAATPVSGKYSEEINKVLSEVRQLIADDLDGYEYRNDVNGLAARSLEDLVPELGGHPIRTVIVTGWRSGSTFLGGLLNSHPANYYHYEPLLEYEITKIRDEPRASEALQKLKSLLNCNYTTLQHYLKYGKRHKWVFQNNERLWKQCVEHPSLCWLPEFLNPFCQLFPFQSMKLVRLKLALVEELLEDESLNVRVILLVRDPRGTMLSRKSHGWCPGNPDCSDPKVLCDDLLADHLSAKVFSARFPNRFTVVRYEDLATAPNVTAKELFQFLGLQFHPKVQQFIESHTVADGAGVFSTYRNSKSAAFHWRLDLPHDKVLQIQGQCKDAMNVWGYVEAHNSTHQQIFNPVTEYKLT